jgi:hypothetical protein
MASLLYIFEKENKWETSVSMYNSFIHLKLTVLGCLPHILIDVKFYDESPKKYSSYDSLTKFLTVNFKPY